MTTHPASPGAVIGDAASRRWLADLRDCGSTSEHAVARLHELLLRMAYVRLLRFQPPLDGGVLDELAYEAADEAVVRVLAHLDGFRGMSLFTTWACQFAITEASVSLRRYRRRTREVPIEPTVMARVCDARFDCDDHLESVEQLRLLCEGIATRLSDRQRAILRALAIDGESPDAVAAAFETNVGALYKSLHDARRKLRAHLAAHGFETGSGKRGCEVRTPAGATQTSQWQRAGERAA